MFKASCFSFQDVFKVQVCRNLFEGTDMQDGLLRRDLFFKVRKAIATEKCGGAFGALRLIKGLHDQSTSTP